MKKTYEKPMIMFESFASSVNIAGDCEVKTDTQAQGWCGLSWGGEIMFVANSECNGDYIFDSGEAEVPYGQYGPFDKVCYHTPQSYNTLFNS